MQLKFRYLWKNKWYYIDFIKDNLSLKWKEYENRAKTTRPEQWTGLKDRFGTDIYKGDILATSNSNPEHDIWDKEEYGYTTVIWEEGTLGFSFSDWHVELEEPNESVYGIEFIEVVGNIYDL